MRGEELLKLLYHIPDYLEEFGGYLLPMGMVGGILITVGLILLMKAGRK